MALYSLYYKAMFNTALRILNNPVDAEDAMQEAFIDAFQKIDQLGDSRKFGSWLKRIVINKALDEVGRRRVMQPLENRINEIADQSEKEEQPELETEYRLEEVKNAMGSLPDQYRVILTLHLFEGMDHEEISDILNLEYNNVRTRYSRARQRLLQEIKIIQHQKIVKENSYVEN
jgi:RNA polymerase sigma-70 factor (ECF subfamily)